MTNLVLLISIILFFFYAFYDQFLMDKLKGETKLCVRLKRQAKADNFIVIGLILLTLYQSIQQNIEPFTLFLLATCIIVSVYFAFIRYPRLLLKENGFFFGNIYFDYQKIHQINLSKDQIIVIDLKNNRRLLVRLIHPQDIENVVKFFGGYKQ